MVFKSVDNDIINKIEEFVRTDLVGIIAAMKSAGKDINEIDFYGDIYVYKPSTFKFSIGDRILILRLVEYAKTIQHVEKPSPNEKLYYPTRTHFFLNRMLETALPLRQTEMHLFPRTAIGTIVI